MTKIIQLTASNVKRLYAVDITPSSSVNLICGANGEGKTSVLDCIPMALAGKDAIPSVPIHTGKDSAEIVIRLDNGLIIRRSFTAAGNSYLKISGPPGSPTGQAGLDALIGRLGFDPLAFIRMESRKQAETLRQLVGLDFTKHDADRKRLYDERTAVNRRLDEMRGAVASLPHYPDAPAVEVSSAEVLAQIEVAQQHNAEQVSLTAAVSQATAAANTAMAGVRQTQVSIAALEKQLAALRKTLEAQLKTQETAAAAVTAAQDELDGFQPIDTTELKATLANAEETNRRVRANAQRAKAIADGQVKKAESDALSARIEKMDEAKSKALAAAKFPVLGLSFADDVVTLDGLPIDQASSAAQQRVSVAIGAALNPRLRVMLIRDGSLLDDRSLAALKESAEELDLQIFIERVGTGDDGGIIIEDGRVLGAPEVRSEIPPAVEKPARKRSSKSAPATPQATTPADAAPIDDPFALPVDSSVPANAAF